MDELALKILLAIGAALIVLNLIASYLILTTYFEVRQARYYQLIFVWLIPFLGAFFAIYFNRTEPYLVKFKRKVGNEPDNHDATG